MCNQHISNRSTFQNLVAPAQGMTRTNRATNQTWLKKNQAVSRVACAVGRSRSRPFFLGYPKWFSCLCAPSHIIYIYIYKYLLRFMICRCCSSLWSGSISMCPQQALQHSSPSFSVSAPTPFTPLSAARTSGLTSRPSRQQNQTNQNHSSKDQDHILHCAGQMPAHLGAARRA